MLKGFGGVRLVLLTVFLGTIPATASAQQAIGRIVGRVVDARTAQPLASVQV